MEFKTKQMTSAMLIFSGLVIVIFSFAFDLSMDVLQKVLPGMIWVALIFSSILGLNRSFTMEKSNDCMQGLLLIPSDRTMIFLGKFISNLIFVLLTQIVIVPGFFILFDYRFQGSVALLSLVLLVGTIGFIAIGTFLAALASNSRMSDMLLPIILFPVSVPLIIAGVQSTSFIFQGQGFEAFSSWLYLMIVFDVIFLVIPYMLFDYVMEV
ncbi:transcriptional regulator [Desulfuribacillus stibiiarsenatis]|uniref:Heme exporter protein B n=2 Tax=Desulfuribacillus stibiiarsenatis TaxID=1390249 RepID=A0A1E5L854_9FIRM|nr:transcriptional regulator [Desulfuribacillus stibiiarsenatis]